MEAATRIIIITGVNGLKVQCVILYVKKKENIVQEEENASRRGAIEKIPAST